MAHKYTDEQKVFIREVSPGRYNQEIADLFNQQFETNLTKRQISSFKKNHNIKSNVPKRLVTEDDGLFTKEQKDFIKQNVKGVYNQELADLVNEKFDLSITAKQISTYKKNHSLTSGINSRFKKGHDSWNKGMKGLQIGGKETQFKKGQRPLNYRPVGSERITKDGYIEIKVRDDGPYQHRWRHKHVVVWEEHHGKKVPKTHAIVFADGDKENLDVDNLLLVTRGELARLNQLGLLSSDPELTKSGLHVVRLSNKITDIEFYKTDPDKFNEYLEIAKRNGLSEQGFIARLKRGWSLQDALYKPKGYRHTKSR